jgi:alkylation response protein AidB-like acyl-CoA dehydrogenase
MRVYGTDEQRARLLPALESCCLAFTEPDHGSDLAAVETRGDVAGDEVIVTGTKMWLADADQTGSAFVLCRTEPTAPRYQNLSCVVIPFDDNHVELRPLRQMLGESHYFEAVFDGARAPLHNIIGGRGNGWRVATSALELARDADHPVELRSEFWDLVDTARRHGRHADTLVRQQLAWAYSQIHILETCGVRAAPEVKDLLMHEYRRRFGEIAIDIVGADALVRPDGEAYATSRWQHLLLSAPGEAIARGTPEIQRNIIAERVLGLPK